MSRVYCSWNQLASTSFVSTQDAVACGARGLIDPVGTLSPALAKGRMVILRGGLIGKGTINPQKAVRIYYFKKDEVETR